MRPDANARPRVPPARLSPGTRIILIASRFHPRLAEALVRGATDTLRRGGVSASRIQLLWVPGAFELPVVAARVARRRPRPDAIIALGAVIRGRTSHYHVLAHAVVAGLLQISVATGVPITCGLIVAETPAQARARAVGRRDHRGAEAAGAALEVVRLLDTLEPSPR